MSRVTLPHVTLNTLLRFKVGSRLQQFIVLNHKDGAYFAGENNFLLVRLQFALCDLIEEEDIFLQEIIRHQTPEGVPHGLDEAAVDLHESARTRVLTAAFGDEVKLGRADEMRQLFAHLVRADTLIPLLQ